MNKRNNNKNWKSNNRRNHSQNVPTSTGQFLRRYRKFIAPIGIIILIIIYSLPEYEFPDWILENDILSLFLDSFAYNSISGLLFLVVLLITIWFAYKSWLLRIRFLRRKNSLVKKMVISFMLGIIVFGIKLGISLPFCLGEVKTFVWFILSTYFLLALFWLILKWVDGFDLSSDLTIWLLRIAGVILVIFGLLSIVFNWFLSLLLFTFTCAIFSWIFFVISLLPFLLGLFCVFRAQRRHAMVKFW